MILQFIYEASYSFSTEDFTAFEFPSTPTFFSAFFYTVLPDGLILYNGMKLFLAFFETFSMTSVFTRYLLTYLQKNSCCNRLKNWRNISWKRNGIEMINAPSNKILPLSSTPPSPEEIRIAFTMWWNSFQYMKNSQIWPVLLANFLTLMGGYRSYSGWQIFEMTIIRKETLMQKEWHKVFFWKKYFCLNVTPISFITSVRS